ncbi:MAG: MotA/TolQ/ExbB proton channel family protein [Myxococcota bacterium]
MNPIVRGWEALGAFIDRGGPVLIAIFIATLILWSLILERLWYFNFEHRKVVAREFEAWKKRAEYASWSARQIRRMLVSRVSEEARKNTQIIQTLVGIAPLFGLLGTVTGMIEVFDVMAVSGNGNPRAMASGVSRATIPTMAGLVVALSGLYFSNAFVRTAQSKVSKFDDELRIHGEDA